MNDKFEYKLIPLGYKKRKFDLDGNEAILTGLGLEGWEAVSAFTLYDAHANVLMKRKIIEEQ